MCGNARDQEEYSAMNAFLIRKLLKSIRRMPRHKTPMKDVVDCDKPRLAVKQAYPRISEWGNPLWFKP